jgi:cytochrome c biogenesis protein CcdA
MRAAAAGFAVLLVLATPGAVGAQLRGARADVTPLTERDMVRAGDSARVALQVSLPDGFHVQSNKPRDPALIPTELAVEPPPGVSVPEIVFPDAVDLKQVGVDEPLAVFERDFLIGVRLDLADAVPAGNLIVPARLRYQACNDTICFAPTTANVQWVLPVAAPGTAASAARLEIFDRIAFGSGEAPAATVIPAPAPRATRAPDNGTTALDDFDVLATTGGYQGSDDFLQFIHNAEAGVRERGLFENRSAIAILLIVFAGGLALNLTPCVLPMIPINLAVIGAGARAGSRRRGFFLGGAYGAAMAVVYGALGLIVILTAGTFGTINSSPWFNLGISALFVALGLAMFDVVTIDFSRFSSRVHLESSRRGSYLLAFGMGAIAALLAGACVAPVVIQVVLFSSNLYATGTTAALALPFLLGAGMAIPWPLAGAGMAALPKPGAWMVRVKQAFGVLILATAVYYGYESYALFANRWVDSADVTSSVEEKLKEGWHGSLAGGLAAARRESKPVLIDLWATWCKNCLTMDRTTLADADVRSALDGYVKIKVQAEEPDREPARGIMRRFGAIGLPTYVILRPKNGLPAAGF